MFTGIVQDVGRIESTTPSGGDIRLLIGHHFDTTRLKIGDSVCVQGCCLTATHVQEHTFAADVSRETLGLTTLGALTAGAAVNLEPALRAGDPLGGHLMSGHVDGVAQVLSISGDARSQRLLIGVPAPLARYLASKGSIAVDGVSLTINEVERASFGVNIIPHTQAVTTLGTLTVGARVNLEVDQIARYLDRLLHADRNLL